MVSHLNHRTGPLLKMYLPRNPAVPVNILAHKYEVPSPDGLQVQMLRTFNEMMSLAKYPAENLALDIKSHVFYASEME